MAKSGTLRITGVVRIMNKVRKQLAAGILPDEAEAFRKVVNTTIQQVEGISLAAGQKPEDLPAPTYRAYRYLKELDLKHLPKPSRDIQQPPVKTVRIANLVASCNRLHEGLWKLAKEERNTNLTKKNPQVEAWSKYISEWVRYLDQTVAGGQPVELTAQAQRAYQWLSFLNDPGNLEVHLLALRRLAKIGQEPGLRRNLPRQARNLEFEAAFANIPALYKLKIHRGKLNLTANEGFINAPKTTLHDIVGAVFQAKGPDYRDKVRKFAQSEEFSESLLDVETSTATNLTSNHTDPRLEESFERVNRKFFGGKLAKPRLTWNQTITHRKFGHYLFANDTVMVSVSLDHSETPVYVLDFIMYHELLHKSLGLKTVNGRSYGHTPEFREAERRYPQYQEAQAFLEKLGKKLL